MRVQLVVLSSLLCGVAHAQEPWAVYDNSAYGCVVEHPAEGFEGTITQKGLTLVENTGSGQIDIYGATNAERLSPADFKTVLADADRIREITYSRNGRSWLVVSGYYQGDDERGGDLIFYAKFMFSADLTRLCAFEASYPVPNRKHFDAIVERMEDTLTAPRR